MSMSLISAAFPEFFKDATTFSSLPANRAHRPMVTTLNAFDYYQTLSLHYYRSGEYEKCVEAAQKALEMNPASAAAWNNICVAYVKLAHWDRAIGACRRALAIAPDYQLATNNLVWAQTRKRGHE